MTFPPSLGLRSTLLMAESRGCGEMYGRAWEASKYGEEASSLSPACSARKGTEMQRPERWLALGGDTYRAQVIRWGHKGWPGAPGWFLSHGQLRGNNTLLPSEAAPQRTGCWKPTALSARSTRRQLSNAPCANTAGCKYVIPQTHPRPTEEFRASIKEEDIVVST